MILQNRFSRNTFIFILCSCSHLLPLAAQNSTNNQTVQKQIIKEIDSVKKKKRLVSLSFGFFQGDNIAFEHATGYATVRNKIAATPEHIYTIASVTKAITAMTLVDLVHQNYLSLGDSVHKIIAGFPENVTVVDLLNHTSGFLREKENENYLSDSSIKDVIKYLPVKFNLKIHRYANFNYAVAGAVIEKVTGREFSEVTGEYYRAITGEDLYFSNHKDDRRNALVTSNYVRKGRRLLAHEPVDFGLWEPAAFAQTTARGLAKFLRYHMTPQFLKLIESHAVKIKERKMRNGKLRKDCYALGFRLRYEDGELKYIYHNGFLYGVISTLYFFPKKDAGFVAISNVSSYPGESLGLGGLYKRIERILDNHFNELLANFTGKNGYSAGLQYYEIIKYRGEAREDILNDAAKDLIKKNRNEEAIAVLKLIKHLFPQSDTAYQRLAEVYMQNGEEELAEETLIQSIMVESEASKSTKMLRRMGSGKVR